MSLSAEDSVFGILSVTLDADLRLIWRVYVQAVADDGIYLRRRQAPVCLDVCI